MVRRCLSSWLQLFRPSSPSARGSIFLGGVRAARGQRGLETAPGRSWALGPRLRSFSQRAKISSAAGRRPGDVSLGFSPRRDAPRTAGQSRNLIRATRRPSLIPRRFTAVDRQAKQHAAPHVAFCWRYDRARRVTRNLHGEEGLTVRVRQRAPQKPRSFVSSLDDGPEHPTAEGRRSRSDSCPWLRLRTTGSS